MLTSSKQAVLVFAGTVALGASCGKDPGDGQDFGSGDTSTSGPPTGSDTGGRDDGGDDASSGSEPMFDVGAGDGGDGGGPPSCKVVDDMNGSGPCEKGAPPDSFDPAVQWSWMGQGKETRSMVTPLVANLTDDNHDGEIDLCDVPDVVVVAYDPDLLTGGNGEGSPGHIYLLDGQTGQLHLAIDDPVDALITPALGDIDGDLVPEIVSMDPEGHLVAFDHEGSVEWKSEYANGSNDRAQLGVALADLDNDGDVEIMAHACVYDHEGNKLFSMPSHKQYYPMLTAADLDGDDDLEVIAGTRAYHHDGSPYYAYDSDDFLPGQAAVADLDEDGLPEVLISSNLGASMLEHDGTIKFKEVTPIDPLQPNGTGCDAFFGGSDVSDIEDCHNWGRPQAVHDFDGDGVSEWAQATKFHYSVFEGDASVVWSTDLIRDLSGISSSTAFDFLGDGSAEAIYTDEHHLWIFDDQGAPSLEVPRTSRTALEYPTVADIDNDGSAEILVVSNESICSYTADWYCEEEWEDEPVGPLVQAIRDQEDRWVPARRIWNQHTYHVTNVREDGTIPQFEKPHWSFLNTFRTQAQVEGGGVCKPDPAG